MKIVNKVSSGLRKPAWMAETVWDENIKPSTVYGVVLRDGSIRFDSDESRRKYVEFVEREQALVAGIKADLERMCGW